MTGREAFEAWIKSEKPKTNLQKRDGRYLFADASSSWKAWQAATAAERERCAKVCESLRDTISDPLVIGEDAYHAGHNALQSAADAIRKGDT